MAPKNEGKKTESRKRSHVELVASQDVTHRRQTGFEKLEFVHNALPELALDEIDTSTVFLGKHLEHPLLISSMTGGYDDATSINRELARISYEFQIAIGVGSARQALENDEHLRSYAVVREENPDGLVFTNIGGAEVGRLSREHKIRELSTIIDLVKADALVVHLNPLQELMQPEGSPDFRGVLAGITKCIAELGVPVIVKEVGAGISQQVAHQLIHVGVRGIDVAGAGGTSWAGVEILRQDKKKRHDLEPFWDWGISTFDALVEVAELRKKATFGLIASGGMQNGVDAAKAIALGADLVGIARPLIIALKQAGPDGLREAVRTVTKQLRSAMFLTGSKDLAELAKQPLRRS